MNHYENPRHSDWDTVKRSAAALLAVCGGINTVKLIGGEPFLYPELYKAVNYFCQNKKVKNVILITNGTILPKGDTVDCLKNDKVIVHISKYDIIKSEKLTGF